MLAGRQPQRDLACLLLAALLALGSPVTAAPKVRNVTVEGTAFHVTLDDGRVLPQEHSRGLILALGDGSGRQRRIRIDSVEHDARDPAGEVVLYGLSEQNPETGDWRNLCLPDPDGRRVGFPLEGSFTKDGSYQPARGKILITCTAGAEGKCVRFGYKPWAVGPMGEPLLPYYQACTRMVRADYCGDGIGHTRDGTSIDLFDRIGIQREDSAAGMTFEAAWGPEGAVCVRRTRIRDVFTMEELARTCPRLARSIGLDCDETAPGHLFNRSFDR